MKLNENFNPYVSPDAYVGYGVRDGKVEIPCRV